MKDATALLARLVELQEASLRLQALSITLQAEALTCQRWAVTGGRPHPGLDRLAVRSVTQMRATIERVRAGKKLPR